MDWPPLRCPRQLSSMSEMHHNTFSLSKGVRLRCVYRPVSLFSHTIPFFKDFSLDFQADLHLVCARLTVTVENHQQSRPVSGATERSKHVPKGAAQNFLTHQYFFAHEVLTFVDACPAPPGCPAFTLSFSRDVSPFPLPSRRHPPQSSQSSRYTEES